MTIEWPKPYPEFDDQDAELVAQYEASLNKVEGPRVGDWIRFSDGVTHRVSHVWIGDGIENPGVQTSAGGSFHLGDGYVSFSGGLDPSTPLAVLTLTEETKPGNVWIFHHNWWKAHNAVHTDIPFRVYEADVPSKAKWCDKCHAIVPGTHKKGDDCVRAA